MNGNESNYDLAVRASAVILVNTVIYEKIINNEGGSSGGFA